MIDLPVTAAELLAQVVRPALTLLPPGMTSTLAETELLAIAMQESGIRTRQQFGGPAHGLWQFETGGVRGVLLSDATSGYAQQVCATRGVEATVDAVYAALLTDDLLACCFARLLLWSDPHALPADAASGWDAYVRTWRPGKPRPDAWPAYYGIAQAAVEGSP